ncbi:MAG: hypothetical protein ILP07_08255 [Treponema sp.]|nr:hypothetical protein [Treponema sp.]
MKKLFWSIIVVSLFITSCGVKDINQFYEENAIQTAEKNNIKEFGEENISRIIKNTLPFEIPASFDEIKEYYNPVGYKTFEDIYFSKINKKYYSGISSAEQIDNKYYLFTKADFHDKKGKVHFIFLSKTESEFNIFDVEFKPMEEGRFNTIMRTIETSRDIDF